MIRKLLRPNRFWITTIQELVYKSTAITVIRSDNYVLQIYLVGFGHRSILPLPPPQIQKVGS